MSGSCSFISLSEFGRAQLDAHRTAFVYAGFCLEVPRLPLEKSSFEKHRLH